MYKHNPEELKEYVRELVEAEIEAFLAAHVEDETGALPLEAIGEVFHAITNATFPRKEYDNQDELRETLVKSALAFYEEREGMVGTEAMRALEKEVLLRSIDISWSDYLISLDHLRQTVGLRAVGGHDPLVEFKREARRTFDDLLGDINRKVVEAVFKIQAEHAKTQTMSRDDRPSLTLESIPGVLLQNQGKEMAREHRNEEKSKVGRNDPCPCGSGKKFKRCHVNNG